MPKTCVHLDPLEAELERRGVPLREAMPSPYGADWGLWSPADCIFEATTLHARIGLYPHCAKPATPRID